MAVTINDSGITFNDGSVQPTALTTGTQTIAGAKTFSSPVTMGTAQMPTPSGTAPLYGARAWCVFDGTLTGTNAPTAGGNVTSVTRNSTGNYTVNITTPMPDANYVVVVTPGDAAGTAVRIGVVTTPARTASAASIGIRNSAFAAVDEAVVSVAIFR